MYLTVNAKAQGVASSKFNLFLVASFIVELTLQFNNFPEVNRLFCQLLLMLMPIPRLKFTFHFMSMLQHLSMVMLLMHLLVRPMIMLMLMAIHIHALPGKVKPLRFFFLHVYLKSLSGAITAQEGP